MDEGFQEVLRQAQARVGRTLREKWTLDRLIGVGGMAAVYAATHRNRKRAAVKLLHPELSFNASIRTRFLREGYVANSIEHPGAVAVDDDDVSEDGCAFLVMELLDGETLEARWERKGKKLPAEEVLSLLDQVLDTLAAAHAKGVVHRDLKPENLFLTRGGGVKILDFGIARVRELGGGASKTQTGSTMGTPAFMPPEQARGRWDEVDGRSDLWAVGATMFTLLAGDYVHVAGTVNEALLQAMTAKARSLAVLRHDLPRPVVELVDRALAFEKGDRWQSATAMQVALRKTYAAVRSSSGEDTVDSAMRRARAELESSSLDVVAAGEPPVASDEPGPARASKGAAASAATLESAPLAASPRARSAAEIPDSPVRLAQGHLTTNRGVESTSSGKQRPAVKKGVVAAAVALVAAFAGVRLGTRAPETARAEQASSASVPVAASPGPTSEVRVTVGGALSSKTSIGPSPLSLDELPPAAARQKPPPRSSASASPAVSAPPESRVRPTPAPNADPFASRR